MIQYRFIAVFPGEYWALQIKAGDNEWAFADELTAMIVEDQLNGKVLPY